ncbi:MAG: transcription initiation factor IIB [Candidatus Bathyarchaeota archaeon]|nr:transcription initiation factor IIB [Candidatus Bathyarchaeota archaeon]
MSATLENKTCEECGSADIVTDKETGELVCTACGTVLVENLIDTGPEWRAFDLDQQQKLTRVGAPLTLTIHDKGLSTMISWQNQDATGRKLKPEEQERQYRLRKWQRRTSSNDSTQRNLTHALSEMNRIANKLNLPKPVVETAAMIYRRAIQKQLIRGRTIQSVVASALYMSCRQCNVIRSLEDVAKAANITRKEAARNYRFLYKELKTDVPPVNRDNLITKFVSKLRITGRTEQLARQILKQASDKKLTIGRAPEGITAACIYIACKINMEERTQGEIAKTAQITEVTIRNRYKELIKNLDFIVEL